MKKEIPEFVLKRVRDPNKFDYFTPEDEERFCELIRESGAISLFLYSQSVLTKDGVKQLGGDKSVRTIAKGGVMYVPVSFFLDFLGRTVESTDGYVPLIETCEALGIFAKTYNDGLLAIVGSEKMHEELIKNPRLVYAGGYATLGKYDPWKFTSDDYRAAREKWCVSLVGSLEMNDLSIPEIKEKVEAAEKKYEKNLANFNRNKNAVILFGTEPPKISYDLWYQYEYLESFATVWAMPGSKYYHDERILDDILFGLEWMYENMYGESIIEERGWRGIREFDWCDWFIRGPDPLTNTMLLIGDNLTMEQKQTYLRCYRWVISFYNQFNVARAMGRIKICTKTAILLEDAQWLENEFCDYDLLLETDKTAPGLRVDFANMSHNYPYNLMYGRSNLERLMFTGTNLSGTPLEFKSPKQYNLFNVAKYMYEPIIYRGRGSMIFAGRGNAQAEYRYGGAIITLILPMIGFFGEDEDRQLKSFIKRSSVMPEVVDYVKKLCKIAELKTYIDILNDETIPYVDGYEIGYSYFTADRAVQQKNDYSFVIALSSNRHPAYESINCANYLGWYTGDGAVYLSTRNDNYTFDGDNFARNEKVMMSVPGTTVDTQKRIPWSHHAGTDIKNPRDFVGSLSAADKYVTCAMDYTAYDYHGETVPPSDVGYGGGFIPHTNDLSCKKAYFLLDKECVCLGAGITSTTGFPVKTVVENRNLVISDEQTIGKDRTAVNGTALQMEDFEEVLLDSPKYASLEGVGGYVFLEDANLSAEKYTVKEFHKYQDGKIKETFEYPVPKRFFKLCIEHGKNPKDGTYAYATIPYATDAELSEYSEYPEIEIISNTVECQAVRKKSIGISSYIFYQAGACEEISVSEPCIVMVLEENGEYEIRVCDPTMKLEKIKVKINRKLKPKYADDAISLSGTELDINTTHSVSRPFSATFKVL